MPAPVLVHVAVMVVPLAPVVVVAAMGRVMVSLRDHDDLSVVLRVPLRLRVRGGALPHRMRRRTGMMMLEAVAWTRRQNRRQRDGQDYGQQVSHSLLPVSIGAGSTS